MTAVVAVCCAALRSRGHTSRLTPWGRIWAELTGDGQEAVAAAQVDPEAPSQEGVEAVLSSAGSRTVEGRRRQQLDVGPGASMLGSQVRALAARHPSLAGGRIPDALAGIRLEPSVLSVPSGVPAMRNRSASKTVPGLLLLSFATLVLAQPAAALNADYWRGGWRTPLGDEPHIYEFVIRGSRVTGVYCRNCSDATTIGFIDGTWDEKAGIDFTVTFANPDGRITSVDDQHAMLADGRLIVTGAAGIRNGNALTLVKDPRGADPGGAPAYHLPPGTPPALPVTRPAGGGGGGGGGRRTARALLAGRTVQGVTAGGRRRHVDRLVRPGHEQADLHLSPGR